MPASASAGTTTLSQTRSVSQAPLGRRPSEPLQAIRQRVDLTDAVARRDRGEHRFRIAAAEHLDLSALDHLAQECHVLRVVIEQPLQQPAAEVRSEA